MFDIYQGLLRRATVKTLLGFAISANTKLPFALYPTKQIA